MTPEEKIALIQMHVSQLEEQRLVLVNVIKELVMELNKAYGVEA